MDDPESGSTQPGGFELRSGPSLRTLVAAGVVKAGNGLYLEVKTGKSPQWGVVHKSSSTEMILLKESSKSSLLRNVFLDHVTSFIIFEAVAFSDEDLSKTIGVQRG